MQKTPADDLLQKIVKRALDTRADVPRHVEWQRLSGGRSNHVWRVGPLVVKLYDPDAGSPVFRNDPVAERRVLRALKDTVLAPDLLGHGQCESGAYVIYEYQEGPTWSTNMAQIGRLLRQLHVVDPVPELPVVPNAPDELVAQSGRMLAECNTASVKVLSDQRPAARPALSDRLVLTHGDVVPSNVIITPDGPRLIDWQCPAIAEPSMDIAIFLSPAMQALYGGQPLTALQEQAFWDGYAAPEVAARYKELRPWFHWRMAVYCAWKSARGIAEYKDAMALELDALEQIPDTDT